MNVAPPKTCAVNYCFYCRPDTHKHLLTKSKLFIIVNGLPLLHINCFTLLLGNQTNAQVS